MRPRNDSLLSSGSEALWSVVSFDDEFPDDELTPPPPINDDDDDVGVDDQRPQPSSTPTTTKKRGKTKPTKAVVRRNERERNRVQKVNQGFDRLRQYVRLPGLTKKKLSKVDTLRAAVVYIQQLQSLLAEADPVLTTGQQQEVASHYLAEPLLPLHQQTDHHHQQQQQPEASFDDVTSPTYQFYFVSELHTGIDPSAESYDVSASAANCRLLETVSASLEPAICSPYSSASECFPVKDVNDNSYIVASTTPSVPALPLLPETDVIEMADSTEQQRRLTELTAWLLE